MSRPEITTPEALTEESVVELSLRPQRLSEVAAQHVADPDAVLHDEGPIEMVLRADGRHGDGIVLFAGQRCRRIAGQELLQSEDQHRDHEQRRHENGEAPRDVEPEAQSLRPFRRMIPSG